MAEGLARTGMIEASRFDRARGGLIVREGGIGLFILSLYSFYSLESRSIPDKTTTKQFRHRGSCFPDPSASGAGGDKNVSREKEVGIVKTAIIILAMIVLPVMWSTNPSSEEFDTYIREREERIETEDSSPIFFGNNPRFEDETFGKIVPHERKDYKVFSIYTYRYPYGKLTRYIGVGKRFISIK